MIAIFKLSNKNSASQSEANPSVRTSSKVGTPLVRACAAQMLWLIILCTPYSPLRAGELQLFTLGSGGVSGSYYAAARALCDEVNRSERGRLRCSPDPTAGSIYNLRALRQGQVDFAFVQSDWQRQAYEGKGDYANVGPMQDLRSVLGLYPEAITILARRDAGIVKVEDLIGKRVDIGHPASGRRATTERLLSVLKASAVDFAQLAELSVGRAIKGICEGQIDATILVLGHPNTNVGQALSDCGVILVPVEGPRFDAAIADGVDYNRSIIARSTYPSLDADVPTYAVTATLVTRSSVDTNLVETVVSRVLERLPRLALSAPVLAGLNVSNMRRRGLTAPLHPGAKAAFKAALEKIRSRVLQGPGHVGD